MTDVTSIAVFKPIWPSEHCIRIFWKNWSSADASEFVFCVSADGDDVAFKLVVSLEAVDAPTGSAVADEESIGALIEEDEGWTQVVVDDDGWIILWEVTKGVGLATVAAVGVTVLMTAEESSVASVSLATGEFSFAIGGLSIDFAMWGLVWWLPDEFSGLEKIKENFTWKLDIDLQW